MKNVTAYIKKNEGPAVILSKVTQLSVGNRLIYVEFDDEGEERVRAYGRKEFDIIELDDVDGTQAVIPLKGDNFKKIDARFEVEVTTTDTDVPAEDTDPEDDIQVD